MAFRFKIVDGNTTSLTPWYAERTPACATAVMNEIRLESPDAVVSIERSQVRAELTVDPSGVDALLRQMRERAGWSEEDIEAGVKKNTK